MSFDRADMPEARGLPIATGKHRRPRRGFSVSVHRQGCVVNLSLAAGDEYGALELYEHFVRSLEQGRLNLDLG